MNNLYEALELCLQDIEQGADVETVLFRYPDLAQELRPILEASAGARGMAVPMPSEEVLRRNRAKVMQYAAQMREAKAGSSQRFWFASLRRMAVTLAVIVTLFVSGTGLVGASSSTVPGDNLYPVKRTWEGLRLLFTFSAPSREALKLAHENERLEELNELFAEGRSEEVDFSGVVLRQNGNEWLVSPGLRVLLTPETEVRDGPIAVGNPVRVRGITQADGAVLAERIRLLSSDDQLPNVPYEHDENSNDATPPPVKDNSGPGSGEETPEVEETEEPENENDNSGSDDDSSGGNENDNSGSDNSNSDSGENAGNDNSGSEDNSGSDDSNNNDNSNDDNNNDSGGGGSDDNSGKDNNDNSGGGGDDDSGGSGNDD